MKKRQHLALIFGVLLTLLLSSSVFAKSLKVALYPYVPRVEQFKQVITKAWAETHTEPIEWVTDYKKWDGGYGIDPSPDYDLFVFDAMFLNQFNAQGYLHKIPKAQVDNFSDFLPWAAAGIASGDNVLGLPQLGCTTVLFYHSDNTALAQAQTLSEVVKTLGTCTFYDQIPPANTGLMADFSSGSSNAGYYVQGLECKLAKFPVPLPISKKEIDQDVVGYIRQVIAMSSFKNVLASTEDSYQRGTWFGENHGNAYIGFTESLSRIPSDQYANISCRTMLWGDNKTGIEKPLFYADVIGIHPKTAERETTDLAIQLANLMASTKVIVDCFGPYGDQGPQYLMPTRTSAFKELASHEMYRKIYAMVQSVSPIMFSLGNDARGWVSSMKKLFTSEYLDDAACYCDQNAGPIFNQKQAEEMCPKTCASHNGWNGQWTSQGGTSYCGCNTPCK